MPTADYDAGCRVRSTSTRCPTRKSRTSSSPPISRPENALASRLLFRQFSKSLAKTCKSGSRKALLHLALESRGFGTDLLVEPVSKSLEQDDEASELNEAEEILEIVFPAHQDTTLPLYPGKEALC